jgi:hypothetical protein
MQHAGLGFDQDTLLYINYMASGRVSIWQQHLPGAFGLAGFFTTRHARDSAWKAKARAVLLAKRAGGEAVLLNGEWYIVTVTSGSGGSGAPREAEVSTPIPEIDTEMDVPPGGDTCLGQDLVAGDVDEPPSIGGTHPPEEPPPSTANEPEVVDTSMHLTGDEDPPDSTAPSELSKDPLLDAIQDAAKAQEILEEMETIKKRSDDVSKMKEIVDVVSGPTAYVTGKAKEKAASELGLDPKQIAEQRHALAMAESLREHPGHSEQWHGVDAAANTIPGLFGYDVWGSLFASHQQYMLQHYQQSLGK